MFREASRVFDNFLSHRQRLSVAKNRDEPLTLMVFDIFKVHGALLRFGDEFVRSEGLASSSWQVLGAVSRGEGKITVPGIARRMGQARQSVQRQVNGLLECGFVKLVDNPGHRRSPYVGLTAAGQRLHDKIQRRWTTWAREVTKSLPVEDIEAVRRALEVFSEALER